MIFELHAVLGRYDILRVCIEREPSVYDCQWNTDVSYGHLECLSSRQSSEALHILKNIAIQHWQQHICMCVPVIRVGFKFIQTSVNET